MTTKRRTSVRCANCLGTRTQHIAHGGDEEGCWCPRCLMKDPDARCREFTGMERPPVDRNVSATGTWHPKTSVDAGERAALRAGSLRKSLYDAIRRAGQQGMTDDEMETLMAKSHQTISAARNTLMNDGWLHDSGQRRRTKWGNPAIVWVANP